jgi:DNA-binding transcriptional MerR regulator
MLRIGELARRTGVSTDLLRAWERRYGLLRPERSAGGFRLYSEDDEARVAAMRTHLAHGLSAAEAARLASTMPGTADDDLLGALLALDSRRAHGILDDLLARLTVEAVLREAVLPALRTIGDRWADGEVSVAQEHFASNVLRGRLLALAHRWGDGVGPRALLACVPGEQHDLPLVMFGLTLRDRGWRIVFLGADTPFDALESAVDAVEPDLVVLSSFRARDDVDEEALRRVAARTTLALAGEWPLLDVDARRLVGDPVAAAHELAG